VPTGVPGVGRGEVGDSVTEAPMAREVATFPGAYGLSTKFGWCQDRFGVSWQLNVA
jgi:predicted 3-demethylubiquinone-9 3-methyltransferase (glyoxalase superfamily)